jgi:condensin complex subunit 3
MGTEATIYAAESSDSNDLLEIILPPIVSDYVDLVKAHIDVGVAVDGEHHVLPIQLLIRPQFSVPAVVASMKISNAIYA